MPPGSPDLARQLVDDGNAAMRQERYDTALAKYRQALKLVPGHPGILNNCAVVLEKLNRLEEAYAAYEQVRRAMPNHPGVLNNCGVVLHKLGKLAEALDQFDRALAQKADYAEALNNRGNVLLKLLRPLEALNSYDRALALRPDHPETLHNRATPLQQLKRYEEAAASLSRAIELAPGLTAARERLFYNRLNYCDWTDYDSAAAAIVADMEAGQTSCDPFFFLGVGRSLAAQRQCAETFAAAEYPVVAAAPPRTRHRKDDRIHIAYVSADFRQHAVAHLTASLFEDHDRRRFEVTGISLGPDDGSEMRQRLQRAFDRFVDVRGKSDHDVAELMRRLKVDIAINLNGYTEGHRTQIFAHRPASVQASYLGYSGTMGAPFIDYIIADSHVIPADLAAGYAEHVVRLPDSFMPSDRNRPIPGETPSRDTVGLPETGFVFCAFNAGYKMRPDVFGVWMKLLRQVDGSLLWLRDESPESTANLRRTARSEELREWLKTLRKKNASVVFATQSLSDIDGSNIAPAIVESCPTRIFQPNERAIEPQITAIYQRFGLNDRQIEIIARATPKRDYYCQSRRGNRLFELGLGPVALAFCAASSKADHAAIERLLAEHGRDDFTAAWLADHELLWAADLIPDLTTLEVQT